MKRITIFLLLLASINIFAQTVGLTHEDLRKELEPLNASIQTLQNENSKLKKDVGKLKIKLTNANKIINSLQKQTAINSLAINKTSEELGLKISTTETSTNEKISAVDQALSKKSLYTIIGVLLAILLSGGLYLLLKKQNAQQKADKSDLIDQLSKTKSSIEESLVKEFGKQTELMETQLTLLEKQKEEVPAASNAEPDHSLALKVADEITLIERNMSLMDPTVKGLKQLARSVSKLRDNLNANGYDMPELLGKPFNQGMKLIVVSSVPDENLEKDVELITKVIKPQVNFNDKMIQTAQIEVSVGY